MADPLDTSAARRNILARVRALQGRGAEPSDHERAAVADYLARHPVGPMPSAAAEPLPRFIERAERMSSTVETLAGLHEVPPAVARYLAAQGIPPSIVVTGRLDGLHWAGAGLEADARAPRDLDLVGVTEAYAGIAETGTLAFLSGPTTPPTANLLPETHIAVLRAERVVEHMETVFAWIRAEHGVLPRAVNFISGPSRTGDIEQTIVLGAHGPYRVHILVVSGS